MSKLKALQSKIAQASRLEVQIEAIDKQIEALSHEQDDLVESSLKALQSKIAEASRIEAQIEAIDKQIETLSYEQDDLVESRKQLEREIEELTGEAFNWANRYNNGVVEVDSE